MKNNPFAFLLQFTEIILDNFWINVLSLNQPTEKKITFNESNCSQVAILLLSQYWQESLCSLHWHVEKLLQSLLVFHSYMFQMQPVHYLGKSSFISY